MTEQEGALAVLSHVVEQLEGPYKWYVIGGVALILTAGITRFVFKTYKWFFLVLAIAALIGAAFWGLSEFAGVTLLPENPTGEVGGSTSE